MKGTDIFNSMMNETGEAREKSIIGNVFAGNVPSWMQPSNWTVIEVPTEIGKIKFKVSPDYIAVGNDEDWVRAPMWPRSAQLIADYYGAILPSSKLSDIIYQAADTRLQPQPIPPSSKMETTAEMLRHNQMVEKTLAGRKPSAKNLIAGHKKDIVVGPGLDGKKVAIYGWHTAPEKPIQPYSTIHDSSYSDYSHGVRLISQFVEIDPNDTIPTESAGSKKVSILDLFQSPSTAKFVSKQGPFYPIFPSDLRKPVLPGGYVLTSYDAPSPVTSSDPEPLSARQAVTSLVPVGVAIGIFVATLMLKRTETVKS